MDISFACKKKDAVFRVPENARVFRPAFQPPIEDTYTAIIKHLMRPLGLKEHSLFDLAKQCKTACVVIDVLYPVKFTKLMLEPILKTLHAAGLSHKDIVILAASEYPAKYTDETCQSILAKDYKDYNIQIHQPMQKEHQKLIGETARGTLVYLDKRLAEADLKIIAGGVHSHAPFGFFSAAMLVPFSLASIETIQDIFHNISAAELSNFSLTDVKSEFFCLLEDLFDLARLSLTINLVTDDKMNVIDIYSGEPKSVLRHVAAKMNSMPAPEGGADIVVAGTNGLYCQENPVSQFQSIGNAKKYLRSNGALIFITSLFDELSADKLDDLSNSKKLVQNISSDIFIGDADDPHNGFFEDSLMLFVSPNLPETTAEYNAKRSVYFFSSIDKALVFAETNINPSRDILVLPDSLLTPSCYAK